MFDIEPSPFSEIGGSHQGIEDREDGDDGEDPEQDGIILDHHDVSVVSCHQEGQQDPDFGDRFERRSDEMKCCN